MKPYLNRTDIQRELLFTRSEAERIFQKASVVDDKELGQLRIFDNKVRITSICKVIGITVADLEQIKSTAGATN